MSERVFQLKVFSGRGLEYEAKAQSAVVYSAVGQLGFYPEHCEYVGLLATGVAECVTESGETVKFVPAGGVCTFKDNVLTLLADTVDLRESADTAILKQDRGLLEAELANLPLFDPAREAVSQKLERMSAVQALVG
jgi:F0F1-type ATP synthase epsilon subunit